MKKILGILVIFAIVGGLSFAQSISVYNEVYSETVDQRAALNAGLTFWGIRNRTGVNISSDKWGIDARYQLKIDSGNPIVTEASGWKHENESYGNYSEMTRFEGGANQLNVWIKPINGLTLRVGNDLGRNVTAGSMTAWDGRLGRMAGWSEPTFISADRRPTTSDDGWLEGFGSASDNMFGGNSSRYAETGFTAEVTAIPYVTLAFNLPAPAGNLWYSEGGNEKFKMKFNAAADVNIANLFDVGAVYRGGFGETKDTEATVGLYADFVGVKGLKIQAGWTGVVNANANGVGKTLNELGDVAALMTLADMAGKTLSEWQKEYNADAYYKAFYDDWKMASLIDLGVQYKFNNGLLLAAAAEMGLGYNWAFPLTVAAYIDIPNIVDTFGFSTRVVWENVGFVNKAGFFNNNTAINVGSLRINPNLKYSIGANAFEIGANFKLGYYNATNDTWKNSADGEPKSMAASYFGFNIPVKWTHYFN